MNIAELPDIQPFSLCKADKDKLLDTTLTSLSRHHYTYCEPYRKMMESIGFDPKNNYHFVDLMFLPVRLFGMIDLCSVPKEEIIRTLTSSGTSGQMRSQIFLLNYNKHFLGCCSKKKFNLFK